MTLVYHGKTVELLGLTPRLSEPALAQLERVQRQRGIRFPPSLCEWYSLEGAVDLLLKYSNADPPVELDELGAPLTNIWTGEPENLIQRGLMPIRFENQAAFIWAVRLEGSDDPPVVVTFNEPTREWWDCDPSFSSHIYAWVWDYSSRRTAPYRASGSVVTSNEADYLRALRTEFNEGPRSFNILAAQQYRFQRGDQRVWLWLDRENAPSPNRASCWLRASTSESLRTLVEFIRQAVPDSTPRIGRP